MSPGLAFARLRGQGVREGLLRSDRFRGSEPRDQPGVELGVFRHVLLEPPKSLAFLLGLVRPLLGLLHLLRDSHGLLLLRGSFAGAGQDGSGQAERGEPDQKERRAAAGEWGVVVHGVPPLLGRRRGRR